MIWIILSWLDYVIFVFVFVFDVFCIIGLLFGKFAIGYTLNMSNKANQTTTNTTSIKKKRNKRTNGNICRTLTQARSPAPPPLLGQEGRNYYPFVLFWNYFEQVHLRLSGVILLQENTRTNVSDLHPTTSPPSVLQSMWNACGTHMEHKLLELKNNVWHVCSICATMCQYPAYVLHFVSDVSTDNLDVYSSCSPLCVHT